MKCRNNKHQNKQIMVIPLRHSGPTLEKWWTLGVIQDVVSNIIANTARSKSTRPFCPSQSRKPVKKRWHTWLLTTNLTSVPFQKLLIVILVQCRLVGLTRQKHLRYQYRLKDGDYPKDGFVYTSFSIPLVSLWTPLLILGHRHQDVKPRQDDCTHPEPVQQEPTEQHGQPQGSSFCRTNLAQYLPAEFQQKISQYKQYNMPHNKLNFNMLICKIHFIYGNFTLVFQKN